MSKSITHLSNHVLTALLPAVILLSALKPALIAHVVMVLGVILIFAWRDERQSFSANNSFTLIVAGLFVAWAACSLQWSILPARGMYDLILLIIIFALMMQLPAALYAIPDKKCDQLIRLMVAFFMLALLIFVTDIVFNMPWQRMVSGQGWSAEIPIAIFSRSGFCLVLLLWPVIYACWRRSWRLPAFFIWLVLGMMLLSIDSAAGRLAFVISTVIYLLASRWPKWTRVLMLAVMLAGIVMTIPAARTTQTLLENSGQNINWSFRHRTEIWRFTAERIVEKPITGWGYDSSRAIPNMGQLSKYQQYDPLKSIIPMHSHNWFLQVMLELGLPGIALFMMLALWLLLQTGKLRSPVQAPALAIYSVAMVVGAFSISIWSYWWLAALIFAAMLVQLLDHEIHRSRQ